jgi:hypothetical protein
MLAQAVDEFMKRDRKRKADALRAMRKVDRPLARFALKRWKDADEVSKATTDMMILGIGAYKVEYVPSKDFLKCIEN